MNGVTSKHLTFADDAHSPWAAATGTGNGDEMVTWVILTPALRSASSFIVALSSLIR
ncbi:MAG: hypothetical protein QOG67_3658 [Verrucomicrobiota bacterium]